MNILKISQHIHHKYNKSFVVFNTKLTTFPPAIDQGVSHINKQLPVRAGGFSELIAEEQGVSLGQIP